MYERLDLKAHCSASHAKLGWLAGILAAATSLACSSSVVEGGPAPTSTALQISLRAPSFVVEVYEGFVKTDNGLQGSFLLDIVNRSGSVIDEVSIEEAALVQPNTDTRAPFTSAYDDFSGMNPFSPLPEDFDGTLAFYATGSNHSGVCVKSNPSTAEGFVIELDIKTPVANLQVRGAAVQLSCGYLH